MRGWTVIPASLIVEDMLPPQIGAATELVDLQLADDTRPQAGRPQLDEAIDDRQGRVAHAPLGRLRQQKGRAADGLAVRLEIDEEGAEGELRRRRPRWR